MFPALLLVTMKFLALLVLLGVSTILVSCQDPETNSTETSGTADSAGENTGSETQADSTDQNQEVDSSDSVEEENVNTDDTNTANEASEEDNKEELNDNSTGDNTSDQNSGVDNTETEEESNAKTKLENMKTVIKSGVEKLKNFLQRG